jgi:hypothetical protein
MISIPTVLYLQTRLKRNPLKIPIKFSIKQVTNPIKSRQTGEMRNGKPQHQEKLLPKPPGLNLSFQKISTFQFQFPII